MKGKFKRVISIIAAFAVVISSLSVSAFAQAIPESETSKKYQVHIESSAHGTIKTTQEDGIYDVGEKVDLEILPEDGFEVENMDVTAADGAYISVNNGSFTMPEQDVYINVSFKEVYKAPETETQKEEETNAETQPMTITETDSYEEETESETESQSAITEKESESESESESETEEKYLYDDSGEPDYVKTFKVSGNGKIRITTLEGVLIDVVEAGTEKSFRYYTGTGAPSDVMVEAIADDGFLVSSYTTKWLLDGNTYELTEGSAYNIDEKVYTRGHYMTQSGVSEIYEINFSDVPNSAVIPVSRAPRAKPDKGNPKVGDKFTGEATYLGNGGGPRDYYTTGYMRCTSGAFDGEEIPLSNCISGHSLYNPQNGAKGKYTIVVTKVTATMVTGYVTWHRNSEYSAYQNLAGTWSYKKPDRKIEVEKDVTGRMIYIGIGLVEIPYEQQDDQGSGLGMVEIQYTYGDKSDLSATFGIYSDEKCTKKVAEIKTNKKGETVTPYEVKASGTYYIKETVPPKGFALSDRVRAVVVNDEGTNKVPSIADRRIIAPIKAVKIDEKTGSSIPYNSEFNLAGAVYGVYNSKAKAQNAKIDSSGIFTSLDNGEMAVGVSDKDGNVHFFYPERANESGMLFKSILNDMGYIGEPLFPRPGEEPKNPHVADDAVDRLRAAGYQELTHVATGSYYIKELVAPLGYKLPDTITEMIVDEKVLGFKDGPNATAASHLLNEVEVTFIEPIDTGEAQITKVSTCPEISEGHRLYSREGAVFTITTDDDKKEVVETLTTDKNGDTPVVDLLPGKYIVQETYAPPGFKLDPTPRKLEVKSDELVEVLFPDEPVVDPFSLALIKVDKETGKEVPMGSGTFANAEYTFNYYDDFYDAVNELKDIKPTRSWVFKTNANGRINFESGNMVRGDELYLYAGVPVIPMGTLTVTETKAPEGYLLDDEIHIQLLKAEPGTGKVLTSPQISVSGEPVIRGGFQIFKFDNEIGKNEAQGGATLEGTEIRIFNRSKNPVVVEGKEYGKDEVVKIVTTDKTGQYTSPADLLPYGEYEAVEVAPPKGYLPTGKLKEAFVIRDNGKIVVLNEDRAISNNPIRGDLKGVKVRVEDMNRLAGVPFKITSMTTGESHTVVTDVNGQFDTSSSWNPHGSNTNRGETDKDGVWFGDLSKLDESKGALLYDQYELEELRCEANEDRELIEPFVVTIERDKVTVNLGRLDNVKAREPEIRTKATDKDTDLSSSYVNEKTTLVDTVEYTNLKVGETYTMKGILMDKSTNKPLLVDGKEITAEKKFIANAVVGTIQMEFVFNSSALRGKKVVVFEHVYYNDEEIGSHADINDEGQTVEFKDPEIQTTAKDKDTGDHSGYAGKKTTIVDVVEYKNLIPGKEYTVSGKLMDKETNKPLLVKDKEVTASKKFTPVDPDGEVELEFTFDSSALRGKEIVVFESLLYKNREIAVHADINDGGQTVKFEDPEIKTTATDKGTDDHFAYVNKVTTIIDIVAYKNLIPDKEYTLKGKLMNKGTGMPVLSNGKEVIAEKTFTPTKPDGSEEMEFTFDSSALRGTSTVVFESLYYEEIEVAIHADINDAGQTVEFKDPEVKTTAKDEESGDHDGHVDKKTTIIDVVEYKNLISGKEYTVKGKLMDKETGKPLTVDGKEITSEKTFKAKEANGSIELKFTFDSSALKGKAVVVFESLYYEDKEIATHSDLNDENQTVEYKDPKLKTTASEKTTAKKVISIKDSVTIVDKIEYENLIPGKKYTVKGVLMDKASGKPLKVKGKKITVEKTFEPKESKGSIEVEFTLNAADLHGKEAVVFEKLFYEDREVGSHEDLKDSGQTVKFGDTTTPYTTTPTVSTSAPKTGDSTSIAIYVAMSVLALSAILLFYKKKKRVADNVEK